MRVLFCCIFNSPPFPGANLRSQRDQTIHPPVRALHCIIEHWTLNRHTRSPSTFGESLEPNCSYILDFCFPTMWEARMLSGGRRLLSPILSIDLQTVFGARVRTDMRMLEARDTHHYDVEVHMSWPLHLHVLARVWVARIFSRVLFFGIWVLFGGGLLWYSQLSSNDQRSNKHKSCDADLARSWVKTKILGCGIIVLQSMYVNTGVCILILRLESSNSKRSRLLRSHRFHLQGQQNLHKRPTLEVEMGSLLTCWGR